MAAHTKTWTALDVIAASHAREAIEYGLMEAGALGTETTTADDDCFNVRGYFETDPDGMARIKNAIDALVAEKGA